MKKFNQNVSVEISADKIAKDLLDKITPSYEGREALVEAIMGIAIEDNKYISHIYDVLHGKVKRSQFEKGNKLYCDYEIWMYKSEESRIKNDSEKVAIGECIVIDTNPYGYNDLLVSYDYYQHNGLIRIETSWTSSRYCTKLPEHLVNL
jgi:hypothetical protein